MQNSKSASSSISFGGLLTVLFIGLKLTEYIDWSWYMVFSPLWIPMVIVLGILGIAVTVSFIWGNFFR